MMLSFCNDQVRTNAKRLVMAVAAAFVVSCSPPSASDLTGINDRPQNLTRFSAVLQLSEPALLTVATRVNGKLQVDPEALARVRAEHDKVAASLAAVSPEIKIVYRYSFVLNAFAISAPKSLYDQVQAVPGIRLLEEAGQFARPEAEASDPTVPSEIASKNSVSFINAHRVQQELQVPGDGDAARPVDGSGVHVGVLDTGIDFTHAMLGGPGTIDAFAAVDPTKLPSEGWPNAKVVGGTDLVGTTYNASSAREEDRMPQPDPNPMDEGGHGTHVAGTIAGIGDGVKTYSGVAPGAKLHAIKVFGADGSTDTSVVVAGMEYSADPNGDGDPSDALDVLNLSLGGSYGTEFVLYSQAIANLAKAGILTVAAAGNSGAKPYIVGSPSTSLEALSVAASVDDMEHNWRFDAVKLSTPAQPEILVEVIEGSVTKPVREAGDVSGKLVPIGLAAEDLSEEQKAALKGHVALIDRGSVSFADKIRRAFEAGAIGVIMVNNTDGPAIPMGGDGSFEIPGIMIRKAVGDVLKAAITAGEEARVAFKTDSRIEKPELIDTMAPFSSQGPRSLDGLLKPEISAPGQNIISAKSGGGAEGVAMSGTSMATPHMAGVMALLRQYRPELSPEQLKAVVMASAKTIDDATGVRYSASRQGSGRVDALAAANARVVFAPAALSLGQTLVETTKTLPARATVQNLSTENLDLSVSYVLGDGVRVEGASSLSIAAGASSELRLRVTVTAPEQRWAERDGWVVLKNAAGEELARMPLLAVVTRTSRVSASSLKVAASSVSDAQGALAKVTLSNESAVAGEAMLFNLLSTDSRQNGQYSCDLESVGWRTVQRSDNSGSGDGSVTTHLQIAAKLWNPVSTWNLCEISVLIDKDGDSVADLELLGSDLSDYVIGAASGFQSILMDAAKMREIRRNYELNWTPSASANYADAVVAIDTAFMPMQSGVAVISADLSKIGSTARFKIVAIGPGDDFLRGDAWIKLSDASWEGMPETTTVQPGEKLDLEFLAGTARAGLLAILPSNATSTSATQADQASKVLRPRFSAP
jgi:minor extracellular serine protease Vpr